MTEPATPVPPVVVYQDGAQFYPADGGRCVYQAFVRVRDGDTSAASAARAEFERWARQTGFSFIWE
jgi:hypothetical protein